MKTIKEKWSTAYHRDMKFSKKFTYPVVPLKCMYGSVQNFLVQSALPTFFFLWNSLLPARESTVNSSGSQVGKNVGNADCTRKFWSELYISSWEENVLFSWVRSPTSYSSDQNFLVQSALPTFFVTWDPEELAVDSRVWRNESQRRKNVGNAGCTRKFWSELYIVFPSHGWLSTR